MQTAEAVGPEVDLVASCATRIPLSSSSRPVVVVVVVVTMPHRLVTLDPAEPAVDRPESTALQMELPMVEMAARPPLAELPELVRKREAAQLLQRDPHYKVAPADEMERPLQVPAVQPELPVGARVELP